MAQGSMQWGVVIPYWHNSIYKIERAIILMHALG